MTVTVFGYLILINMDFYDFSIILVSIEKIPQTLKTVFYHISKHLEVHQKRSAGRGIFNSSLGFRYITSQSSCLSKIYKVDFKRI